MTEPAPLPIATPPGWYPEPGTRRPRWWDGIQWAFYPPEGTDTTAAAAPSVGPTPTNPYPSVAYPAAYARPTNAMATASLTLGLVGLVTCTLVIPSVLAIVFGAIGVRDANRRGGHGKTRAVWGIVLGGVMTLVAFLLFAAGL